MDLSLAKVTRQRASFTDIERQGLREHHQKYPTTSRLGLVSWFELQFGRKISVSSVPDILSSKYAYLDGAEATAATRKQRGPQWQDLENALFVWWQQQQPRRPTGIELKDKARELWSLIPAFDGKALPSFQDGWLSNWRNRHGIAQSNEQSLDLKISGSRLPVFENTERKVKRQRSRKYNADLKSHPPIFTSISENLIPEGLLNTSDRKHKTFQTVDLDLWKQLADLSCEYSTQNAQHKIIPTERLLDIFKPILTAAKERYNPNYHNAPSTEYQHKTYGRAFPKPIPKEIQDTLNHFKSADAFKLQRCTDGMESVFLEDWFLDYMSPEVLRVQSLEPIQQDDTTSGVLNQMTTEVVGISRCYKPSSSNGVSFLLDNGGRCDVLTRTYLGASSTYQPDIIVNSRAEIIITPPKGKYSVPKTIFRFSSVAQQCQSILLTPVISFRRMRPKTDRIFRIAGYGTSSDLQKAFCTGKASPSDCDSEGRSLTNYALQGYNPSTLKYLLAHVDDVSTYETFASGRICPLAGIGSATFWTILSPSRKRRRQSCVSLLLDYGADFSLPLYPNSSLDHCMLEFESAWSPVSIVKLILDKGGPLFGPGSNISPKISFRSLLSLLPVIEDLDLCHKIYLLLERGFDLISEDSLGNNCFHLLFYRVEHVQSVSYMSRDALKEILMCFVTSRANINACNSSGEKVNDAVFKSDQEEVWIGVLTECGYDTEPLFQDLDRYYRGINCCFGAFATAVPSLRSPRLSLADFGKQRKFSSRDDDDGSFPFSAKSCKMRLERHHFVKYVEDEDENKYEDENEDEDQKSWATELDAYSTVHGADWRI